jgi:5-methylcytosine-specific restriction endonuclease McrA
MANKSGVPGSIRAQVFARDRYTCFRCGARGTAVYGEQHVSYPTENGSFLSIHHRIPKSKGGALKDPRNLLTACVKCNSALGTTIIMGERDIPD